MIQLKDAGWLHSASSGLEDHWWAKDNGSVGGDEMLIVKPISYLIRLLTLCLI